MLNFPFVIIVAAVKAHVSRPVSGEVEVANLINLFLEKTGHQLKQVMHGDCYIFLNTLMAWPSSWFAFMDT